MALRRILLQIGILAGSAAFSYTLWQSLHQWHQDLLQASIRATGAGIAVIFIAMFISGVIEKLGGSGQ